MKLNDEDARVSFMDEPSMPRTQNPFESQSFTLRQVFDTPDVAWDVEGLLKPFGLGFFVGKRGSGKTMIIHSFIAAMAKGSGEFAERFGVNRPMKTLYVTDEGKSGLKPRLQAIANRYELSPEEESNIRVLTTMPNVFNDAVPTNVSAFIEFCQGFSPDVIVFDTLANLMVGGDENSQRDAGIVISALKRIQDELSGCRIGIAHHESRGGNFRGSTVFEGAADFIISVTAEDDPTKGVMSCLKMKDAKHFQAVAFRLEQDPVDDSLCSVTWEGNATVKGRPQGAKQIGMKHIADVLREMASDIPTSLPTGKIIEYVTPRIEADLGEGRAPKATTLKDYISTMYDMKTYGIEAVSLAKGDPFNKSNAVAMHYYIPVGEE